MKTFQLRTLQDTQTLAEKIANLIEAGDVLLLQGPVGSGKTEFTRFVIRHLLPPAQKSEAVPSPTFTLVQTYETIPPIWHFDLYRITNPDEIWELGIEEGLAKATLFIEWPENLGPLRFKNTLTLAFIFDAQQDLRQVILSGTDTWHKRLDGLA